LGVSLVWSVCEFDPSDLLEKLHDRTSGL
jgi:hypothetical protein